MPLLFFFFKQKTAYEMRISDWSSDVCSSDLAAPAGLCCHRPVLRSSCPEPPPDRRPNPAEDRHGYWTEWQPSWLAGSEPCAPRRRHPARALLPPNPCGSRKTPGALESVAPAPRDRTSANSSCGRDAQTYPNRHQPAAIASRYASANHTAPP